MTIFYNYNPKDIRNYGEDVMVRYRSLRDAKTAKITARKFFNSKNGLKYLAKEIKNGEEVKEAKSVYIDLSKFKAEPRVLYFDYITLKPVYNSITNKKKIKKSEKLIEKSHKLADECLNKRIKAENNKKADYWSRKIEIRKKKTEKEQKKRLNEAVKNLGDGSYKIEGAVWVKEVKKSGYWYGDGEFNGKLSEGQYLGVWHDKDDNDRLHLDCSRWAKTKKEALSKARKGEKAIWDCKNNKEIRL